MPPLPTGSLFARAAPSFRRHRSPSPTPPDTFSEGARAAPPEGLTERAIRAPTSRMANIRLASFAPVMLACALLGTGCTAPSETLPGSGSPQSFAPIEPSASFQLPANVDTSGDRLIVLTGDGNLVTVDPTGKNVAPF